MPLAMIVKALKLLVVLDSLTTGKPLSVFLDFIGTEVNLQRFYNGSEDLPTEWRLVPSANTAVYHASFLSN